MRSLLNPFILWVESLFVVTWLLKRLKYLALLRCSLINLIWKVSFKVKINKRKRGLRTEGVLFYEISIQPWIRYIHLVSSGLGFITPHFGTRFCFFLAIFHSSRFPFHHTGQCLDRPARGDLLTFCTWNYQDQTFYTLKYQEFSK